MDLNEYQSGALRTAAARTKPNEMLHLALGLAAEAGEVASVFQKLVRDSGSDPESVDREALTLELGDVLWHSGAGGLLRHRPRHGRDRNIEKITDRER